MDNTDLLVAAKVHRLATEIRYRRWIEFIHAANLRTELDQDSAIYERMRSRWEIEHPIAHYVPEATAQLKNVAIQLKSINKEN